MFRLLFTLLLLVGPIFSQAGEEEPFLPVMIENESNIASDSEVYILLKGLNPVTGADCFVVFDHEGVGDLIDVKRGMESEDFSFTLDELPEQLLIPQIASGRLYVSIGYPMTLDIVKGRINDADGFKPRDVNYYTLYDKVELSFDTGGSWVNPTAVDFFSLPLRLYQSGSISEVTEAGLFWSRADILEQLEEIITDYDQTEDREWSKLFLNYTSKEGDVTLLRFMSPGKAMISGVPGTDPFDENYLNDEEKYGFDWIDFLWNYYETNTVVIDCSEIAIFFPLDDYQFTGRVEGDNFVFTNESNTYTVSIPKPLQSTPFFAGAIAPFDAANNTPKAVIIRQLTSAFEVGLIPAVDGITLDRSYFDNHKEYYFENSSFLPHTEQGPWYDLYSQAMHSFGEDQPIYSFAYDDALGQDGTLHDSDGVSPTPVVITLGDMSGTIIPNPYEDDRLYNVTVYIGDQSTVVYNGEELEQGEKLENVPVPFRVELNGVEAEIYFDPAMVRPVFDQADGIVIDRVAESEVNVTFPGLPLPSVSD